MFSVDNFYYVLYKNLLESTNFSARYFYPFGSTNIKNLCTNWDKTLKYNNEHLNNVLFYDQEPLLVDDLPYQIPFTSYISCNILANSEKSNLKTKLCKTEKYLDWYYFYHGFASLYWFNDFKYLPKVEHHFTKVFISLNRLHTNYRSYRLNLINEYIKKDLIGYGNISLPINNIEFGSWNDELDDPNTLLPKTKLAEIKRNLNTLTNPLVVDKPDPKGFLSADCGTQALEINQSALWHIVSETIFYQDKLHLTEKIFKPIATRRPFILLAAPGNLAYLKSYGFKTFDKWIDESYDKIHDPDHRICFVVEQIEKLCKLNLNQLKDMHREMQNILDHNYNHFYTDFKTLITDELLDNFKTCISIYNNGRMDDRTIPIQHLDFAQIKKLFLR